MMNISPVPSANPTPFILALGACHVLATLIFLDWNVALRTLLGFYTYRPFFKQFGLLLFTCQILMPWHDTLKAKVLFAILAGHLRCLFRRCFNYHIHTFGIRTELLEITPHYLLIGFELPKLFENFRITDSLDKFIGNRLIAPLLRTFDKESFAPRLCNLICQEIFIAVFAKCVTATCIRDKIFFIMFFIAYFTEPGIQNLHSLRHYQWILQVILGIGQLLYQERFFYVFHIFGL